MTSDFVLGTDYTFDAAGMVREGRFDPSVLLAPPGDQPALFDLPAGVPLGGLAVPARRVAAMTWPQREARIQQLLNFADLLFYQASWSARNDGGPRTVVAVAGMLSGGNDSTAAVYAMRPHLTHLIHADTGVCLAVTREFTVKVAADLGIPLLIPRAPRPEDSYVAMVREHGFPGPGRHARMMNRLKERAWRAARKELVTDGWRQRMIQVAGRRRDESAARADVPEMQRDRSVVWVSPMVLWTKLDLNTWRRMHAGIPPALSGYRYRVGERRQGPIPQNPVYDNLHYSGECICGAKSRPGEREWLFEWFGDDPAVQLIRELEAELAGREDIPPEYRIWGAGGGPDRCTTGLCND
jgi:3'-phosphoadenosine 5'-phosphosulfate sulfotransferase (PAPS reductase)/FAD synthetase